MDTAQKRSFKNEEERQNFAAQTKFMNHFKVNIQRTRRGANKRALQRPTTRKASASAPASPQPPNTDEKEDTINSVVEDDPDDPGIRQKRVSPPTNKADSLSPTDALAMPSAPVFLPPSMIPIQFAAVPVGFGLPAAIMVPLYTANSAPADATRSFSLPTAPLLPPQHLPMDSAGPTASKRRKTAEVSLAAETLSSLGSHRSSSADEPANKR
jgi:hypothetical protein